MAYSSIWVLIWYYLWCNDIVNLFFGGEARLFGGEASPLPPPPPPSRWNPDDVSNNTGLKDEKQLHLENYTTYEHRTCTIALLKSCTFLWCPHRGPKVELAASILTNQAKSTVRSKRARLCQHSNDTPQHLRQLQHQKSGMQQKGLGVLPRCRNPAENWSEEATGSGVR